MSFWIDKHGFAFNDGIPVLLVWHLTKLNLVVEPRANVEFDAGEFDGGKGVLMHVFPIDRLVFRL